MAGQQHPTSAASLGAAALDLGDTFFRREQVDTALVHYLDYLRLREELGADCPAALAEKETEARERALACALAIAERALNVGDRAAAARAAMQALTAKPDNGSALRFLGALYASLGELELAEKYLLQSVCRSPGDPEGYRLLGDTFFNAKEYRHAIEAYQRYCRCCDTNPLVYNRMGNIYIQQFGGLHLEQAMANFRRSHELRPDADYAIHNLLLTSLYSPATTQRAYYERSVDLVAQHLRRLGVTPFPAREQPRQPRERLHVGYVSGDFRHHVVMYFIEKVLEHHDKNQFTVTCYSNVPNPDGKTVKARGFADTFREIQDLSDQQAAELIRADQVDILVDLSGHSSGSRVFLFGYRPAPVQVTYCGFPNTTGLTAIDYLLTDELTIARDEEHWFSEKPFWLDYGYECYSMHLADLDRIVPPPVLSSGAITFGFFNALAKLSYPLLEVFATILARVPGSRLLIQRGTRHIKDELRDFFCQKGIDGQRLVLFDQVEHHAKTKHYRFFNHVDIALDPFPYNGTTTTVDCLLMGVPVVCRRGDGPHQRATARLNTCLGLRELIAHSDEEYIDLAVQLANDLPRLREYRCGLREQFELSPLMAHVAFTRSLERAYHEMWRRYLAEAMA